MASRIVVFGATGYTGRLVLGALLSRGCRPVVTGRDEQKVAALAAEHGGLQTAIADVARPKSVRALVEAGDVLVTTVGPFLRYGQTALDTAVDAGAHYVDPAGESDFIRSVFTEAGPRAQATGSALLTGFGYYFVAGNLAGALATRDAGPAARRVDVAYLFTGETELSSGTRATVAASIEQRSHMLRAGLLVVKPFAREAQTFWDGAQQRQAVLLGGTEPLALTRIAPQLTDVAAYLTGPGTMIRGAQVASYVIPLLLRIPVVRTRLRARADKALQRTGEGPDAATRTKSGMLILAAAYDAQGKELATVRMEGANAYDFTARMMASAASRLAAGELHATGALGPADAFGIDELERVGAEAGLRRTCHD
jgi:short subunit dehydrogenase-like uncharacterized protein